MALEENVLPMSVVEQWWLSWTKHSAERQNLWLISSHSPRCVDMVLAMHIPYTPGPGHSLMYFLFLREKKKCYRMPLGIHYRYHLGCRMMRVWQTASIMVHLCHCISPVNPKSHLYHVDLVVFVHDIPLHKNMQPDMYKFLRHYFPFNIYKHVWNKLVSHPYLYNVCRSLGQMGISLVFGIMWQSRWLILTYHLSLSSLARIVYAFPRFNLTNVRKLHSKLFRHMTWQCVIS